MDHLLGASSATFLVATAPTHQVDAPRKVSLHETAAKKKETEVRMAVFDGESIILGSSTRQNPPCTQCTQSYTMSIYPDTEFGITNWHETKIVQGSTRRWCCITLVLRNDMKSGFIGMTQQDLDEEEPGLSMSMLQKLLRWSLGEGNIMQAHSR